MGRAVSGGGVNSVVPRTRRRLDTPPCLGTDTSTCKQLNELEANYLNYDLTTNVSCR